MCIKIVEHFCQREDVILNGKKTAWMKLGEKPLVHPISKKKVPRPSLNDENFVANGVMVEKVYSFKYLGYMITSDDDNNTHINARINSVNMAKKELNKINLKNSWLDPEIKGCMVQSLCRSTLVYGMENANLCKSKIDRLITIESNIIKEYIGVARRSYTTPLIEVTKIKSLEDSLKIRRYSMLLQLLTNEVTSKLVLRDDEHNYSTTITECGYRNLSSDEYLTKRNKIASCCLDAISTIKYKYKNATQDIFTKAVEYLLKNHTPHNYKLLKFLLHSKNKIRDFI